MNRTRDGYVRWIICILGPVPVPVRVPGPEELARSAPPMSITRKRYCMDISLWPLTLMIGVTCPPDISHDEIPCTLTRCHAGLMTTP